MSRYEVRKLAAQWGMQPEREARVERLGVSAAIWCGCTTTGFDEIEAGPDEATHVIGVGLAHYECQPFADGKRLFNGTWRPWRAQIMPAGVRPRALFRGRWRLLQVYVPAAVLAQAADRSSDALEIIDPLGAADPVLHGLARQFVSEMAAGGSLARLQRESLSLALAVHLVRRWSNCAGERVLPRQTAGLAPWQARRACDYLDAHIAFDVSLADLAAQADLSPAHFCRGFKQFTGMPPHRWQIARRVESAQELLAGTGLSVTEVAARVGYGDPNQLARVFRKHVGISPGQYRKEHKG